jgi:hypothetical protein
MKENFEEKAKNMRKFKANFRLVKVDNSVPIITIYKAKTFCKDAKGPSSNSRRKSGRKKVLIRPIFLKISKKFNFIQK